MQDPQSCMFAYERVKQHANTISTISTKNE